MRPMVTDSPTDTMNSTMPAASPPSSMLATSIPKITLAPRPKMHSRRTPFARTGRFPDPHVQAMDGEAAFAASRMSATSGARRNLLRLAGILHVVDLADHLLGEAAILHDYLGEVLVHDNVARVGVDHDRAARAVEFPTLERVERGVRIELALGGLHSMHDRCHAVIAADRHEVGRRV